VHRLAPAAALLLCLAGPGFSGAEPASSPASTSESARVEADRQITFARKEVAESRFERALASAESALRLCPDCREATLLKALAYDGLGDRKIAIRLLQAYKQEAPEAEHSKADRILAWFDSTPRTRPVGLAGKGFASILKRAVPTGLDAAPYRVRLEAALGAKQCAAAAVAAEEWIRAEPTDAEAHRKAAGAAICADDARFAARLLRRWAELGLEDDRGPLEAVASAVATLTVTGAGADRQWVIDAGGEWIPGTASSDGLVFADLPPETDVRLLGFQTGDVEPAVVRVLAPLRPAEHALLALR